MADQIDKLTAAHEKQLAEALEAAFAAWLETIDTDQLASALDETDAAHIREQVAIIFGLDETETPPAYRQVMGGLGDLLASFIIAVAALASSQANHVLNRAGEQVKAATQAGHTFLHLFNADTAHALTTAIEAAIYGPATPLARAAQLKRSIGLSVKQHEAVETMREALQQFVDAPRRYVPGHVDATGKRVPPKFVRKADTRAILASTRGHISAAQRQILSRALSNPNLTQANADAILDKHANALRSYRVRAVASQAIHELSETAKLAGWTIAQHFGALPSEQRRYWQTAGDERVRHAHSQVVSMNPAGVPLTQPFATPFGPRMCAPLEWGCRCKAVLRPSR